MWAACDEMFTREDRCMGDRLRERPMWTTCHETVTREDRCVLGCLCGRPVRAACNEIFATKGPATAAATVTAAAATAATATAKYCYGYTVTRPAKMASVTKTALEMLPRDNRALTQRCGGVHQSRIGDHLLALPKWLPSHVVAHPAHGATCKAIVSKW